MILNIVKKMISSRERINILKELAGRLPVTLYSQSALCNIPGISQYGYIDYEHDMPVMFANSCINLNIDSNTSESVGHNGSGRISSY